MYIGIIAPDLDNKRLTSLIKFKFFWNLFFCSLKLEKFNRKGIITYTSGDNYSGEFKDNKKNQERSY